MDSLELASCVQFNKDTRTSLTASHKESGRVHVQRPHRTLVGIFPIDANIICWLRFSTTNVTNSMPTTFIFSIAISENAHSNVY